jgi:hypothetical protein
MSRKTNYLDIFSEEHKKWIEELIATSPTTPIKDFSVLQDFTDEELANELCRRTGLGKELE